MILIIINIYKNITLILIYSRILKNNSAKNVYVSLFSFIFTN